VIWQDLREPRFRGLSRKENAPTETQPYLAGLVTDHDRMTNPTKQEEPRLVSAGRGPGVVRIRPSGPRFSTADQKLQDATLLSGFDAKQI
jgi:hypothetical protein